MANPFQEIRNNQQFYFETPYEKAHFLNESRS